jgi:acyl-CoA synthetase (NDP forming)
MWRYSTMREQVLGSVHEFDIDHDEVARLIEATRRAGQTKVSEPDALRVLQAAGIPVVPWTTVDAGDDLGRRTAAAARKLGYPVVLKVISREISHKSDVGGIEIGIDNDAECAAAVSRIIDNVTSHGDFCIDGLLVQRMAAKGIETILGLTRNPGMPPIVMFGLGGIYVEVMKDVVMRLCPVSDSDAAQMVRGVKMHALLRGVRGDAPRDLGALEAAIQRVSQLAWRHPQIVEMDINPMLSLPDGAIAIDARIRIEE